jgi:uncharacterized protein
VRFVDSNVLIRFFVREPPEQHHRSVELLLAVERGDESIALNHMVIFETTWVLTRTYKFPLDRVRELMLDIIRMPSVRVEQPRLISRAFEVAIEQNIPFADGYNAAFMELNDLSEVYAWDRHFDRIDSISRIEPGESDPTA